MSAHAKIAMDVSKYEFLQELQYFSQRNSKAPHYAKNLKSTTAKVAVNETTMAKSKTLNTTLRMLEMSGRFPRIWMARRRRDDKVREPYLSVMDQITDRKRCTAFLGPSIRRQKRACPQHEGVTAKTVESSEPCQPRRRYPRQRDCWWKHRLHGLGVL